MDEKPDQIIDHIEAKRDELGRNLSELEDKVRRTADWRTHFDKNPMLILGAALGGGLLVGSMVGGSRSRSYTRGIRPRKSTSYSGKYTSASSQSSSSYTPASTEHSGSSFAGLSGVSSDSGQSRSSLMSSGQMHQVGEALDHIKGALIAFGIAKTKEFLSQAVPGLENHLADFAGSSHRPQGQRDQSDQQQTRPYSTESSADYRSGSQNYGGGGTSYGAGSSSYGSGGAGYGSGSSMQNPNPGTPTTNTGRASEADEYAGAGTRAGGSTSSSPSTTPQPKP